MNNRAERREKAQEIGLGIRRMREAGEGERKEDNGIEWHSLESTVTQTTQKKTVPENKRLNESLPSKKGCREIGRHSQKKMRNKRGRRRKSSKQKKMLKVGDRNETGQ